MDIEQKKGEVKGDIARGPENVIFSRIDICDEIQLADLMKEQFTPYFNNTASQDGTGDSLHQVCVNLAKQRALLQGATAVENPATGILTFAIGTTTQYSNSAALSLPDFTDSSYSNKTSFGFITLHDVNETGGSVTLSSTSNANTSITDDDGNAIKYFTDFSKYFLTRSRANGEIISIDENTAPYMVPTISEPFIPSSTINGEIFRGTAPAPTANSDVRYEFSTTANTSGGNAGGDLDIVENKWVGNTFVTIEISDVVGTFATSETISDYDLNTATIKTYANTTTVLLEGQNSKGTFVVDELISDLSTNATISTVASLSDTEVNLTLTGSTFITGSNTDITLGYDTSNTISLDTDAVSRSGGMVTIIANSHGISPGERISLKGADTEYNEFNDTFIVEDTTSNTLTFTTSNTTSVTPTGDFSLVDNIVFGRTSNASMSIFKRTANSSAQIVFQSDDLSAGFPIANTITGSSFGATGMINSRVVGGTWYQSKTNEVKTFFSNSTIGTWDYDATNNSVGIPAAANAGVFWLQEFEPVKIDQIVAGTNAAAATETSPKMVLDIAIATASDKTGGFDTTINTKLPGIYFAYPLKTYADQVHDGVTTLNAYESFANVITAPEGLEINFDWLPLSQDAAGNKTGDDIARDGSLLANTAFHGTDKMTTLNKANFNSHLGVYGGADTSPVDDVFRSTNPDTRSSGVKDGKTFAAIYKSVNTNPFYPAVTANSDFLVEGYMAPNGANTANDIFAGSYTHVETGAVEPDTDYRYIIQNDLKWCYATSPFATPVDAAASTGQGEIYNKPKSGTDTYTASYDGYSKSSDGFGVLIDSVESQAGGGYGTTASIPRNSDRPSAGTTTDDGAQSSAPALTSYWDASGSGGNIVKANATHYGSGQANQNFDWNTTTVSGTGHSMVVTTAIVRHAVASSATALYSGTAASHTTSAGDLYGVTASTPSNTAYLINRVGAIMLKANTVTFHTMLASLQTGNDTTYGAGYSDPNEPTSPNLKTDSTFDSDVNTMSGLLSSANTYHQLQTNGSTITNSTFSSGTGATAVTYTNTTYNAWLAGIGTFQTAMKLRITEISNRIGYLNGKGSQTGGIADGGSGTQSSGHSTANGAFAGTDFNGGKGYANTIYSHANFLAGKKINLLGKVLKAILAVQAMYDSVDKKRSEYYEYNQAS